MPEHSLDNTVPAHPDHGPVVVGERPCSSCGYTLAGLPISGLCPECAHPIARSLRGELLQFASPAYLRSVHTGLRLVSAAIIAYIITWVLAIAAFLAFATRATTTSEELIEAGFAALFLIPGILFIIGYWKFTTPDPGFTGLEKPASARTIARIAACVQPAAKLGATLLHLLSSTTAGNRLISPAIAEVLHGAFRGIDLIAFAMLFFAITLYTRWLATRVPDKDLIRQTRTFIWLLPLLATVGMIACGLGPLVALILYYNMLDALRTRVVQSIRFQGLNAAIADLR